MEKIEFKNNEEPYLSAENLNLMQDNIEKAINEKNYIVATSTGTINANGNKDISLTQISSAGTKLTITDGKIKVGANVSKVRINGSIFLDITYIQSAGYVFGRIAKNNSNIGGTIQPIVSNMSFISTPISSNIIEVEEGDLFHLNVDASNLTGIIRNGQTNTWLCVEVIE